MKSKLFSILKWLLGALLLLTIVYFVGPRAKFEAIDKTPVSFDIPLDGLDAYVADKESDVSDIKPGNEAKIVWADSLKQKTEYAIVYLHGFSASHEEGAPVHTNTASRYGYNLYLSRLYDHGRKSRDMFKYLRPDDLINSAKEAIAVGKLLGDKVILMTCSTGSTFAAILADQDPAIHSIIMYSPNIDVYDTNSKLVTGPWGRQLVNIIMGEHVEISYDSLAVKYWSPTYHSDGIVALKYLIEEEMTADKFAKIKQPIYMSYYYKDEENQDKVVSVDRMLDFFDEIGTPEHLKVKEAFPDATRHVFVSHVFSPILDKAQNRTWKYMDEVLNLKPLVAD